MPGMGQDSRQAWRWIATVASLWLLVFLVPAHQVQALRFTVDRKECLSYEVEAGDDVYASFVLIEVESSWKFENLGIDLVVEAPAGYHVHSSNQKVEEKFSFKADKKGFYKFCFYNRSPVHETIVFEVHLGHLPAKVEHATDEHFDPVMDQVARLEETLYRVEFEQHWLQSQTERQAFISAKLNKRIMYKAFLESVALIGASAVQVYLLRRLFEKKQGFSRV